MYEEASAVLYSTAYLGPYAPEAVRYLEFLGPRRVRQIRTLVLSYKCEQMCHLSYGYERGLYWAPVFELLHQGWACVRHVRVLFDCCSRLCGPSWRLDTGCRLRWDEDNDTFFSGLRALRMAEHIDFMVPVPEYFAHRHAREFSWRAKGMIGGDDYGGFNTHTQYRGLLINPTFPVEFDRILDVHSLIEQGCDVSALGHSWDKKVRMQIQNIPAHPTAVASPTKHFFALPLEIRRLIYDFSSEWVEKGCWPSKPLRWNTGVDLLCTCKQVAHEALPSLYRNFRIYAPSTLKTLNRLGLRAAHIQRLELYFTCFCPSALDRRDGFRKSIHAEELAVSYGRTYLTGYVFESGTYQRYRDTWSFAMARVQALTLVRELKVTFSSCCRYPVSRFDRWFNSYPALQAGCRMLENHFLGLLADCRHVNRLVLAGDVPPSFAVRISRRPTGIPLSLKWTSPKMRDFVERAAREGPELKSAPYPHTHYWQQDPPTQFILAADGTTLARWEQNVGDGGRQAGEGTASSLSRAVLSREWEDLHELLDYENLRRFSEED